MMSNLKKVLDGGAVLEVTMSPFKVGLRLLQAVTSELEKVSLNFGLKGSFQDLMNLDVSDDAVNTVKNLVSRIVCSDAISTVLWECMQRATYDGKKITEDTFEDEKARGDYLIVAKEVLWFNLSPFLQNLKSLFQNLVQERVTDTQKLP